MNLPKDTQNQILQRCHYSHVANDRKTMSMSRGASGRTVTGGVKEHHTSSVAHCDINSVEEDGE